MPWKETGKSHDSIRKWKVILVIKAAYNLLSIYIMHSLLGIPSAVILKGFIEPEDGYASAKADAVFVNASLHLVSNPSERCLMSKRSKPSLGQ
jgi:hypothetical protein